MIVSMHLDQDKGRAQVFLAQYIDLLLHPYHALLSRVPYVDCKFPASREICTRA